MTGLGARTTSGRYFEAGDESVIIAEGVAKNMKLGIGDTLVLISTGMGRLKLGAIVVGVWAEIFMMSFSEGMVKS